MNTDTVQYVCMGIFVAVSLLAIPFIRRTNKKREAEDRRFAAHHRLSYQPVDETLAGLSWHKPFGVGRSRKGHRVFRGIYRNRHLVFGEYYYETGSSQGSTEHVYQVVAVSTPTSRPFLDITQETAGSKFLAMLGSRDLQLESQAFNDRFKIDTDSERFAYDVLSPRNMEWLLADVRANMYHYRFEGQWLMTMRSGGLVKKEVFFYADFLNDLVDIVPDFVWRN